MLAAHGTYFFHSCFVLHYNDFRFVFYRSPFSSYSVVVVSKTDVESSHSLFPEFRNIDTRVHLCDDFLVFY